MGLTQRWSLWGQPWRSRSSAWSDQLQRQSWARDIAVATQKMETTLPVLD